MSPHQFGDHRLDCLTRGIRGTGLEARMQIPVLQLMEQLAFAGSLTSLASVSSFIKRGVGEIKWYDTCKAQSLAHSRQSTDISSHWFSKWMQCCGFLTLVGNGGTAVGDLGVYHPPQASPVKMQHMTVVLSWARITAGTFVVIVGVGWRLQTMGEVRDPKNWGPPGASNRTAIKPLFSFF